MQNASRSGISRVVMLYREENFDRAVESFRATLGVTDFDGPIVLDKMGLRIAVSWDTGLELITPHGSGGFADHMRAHLDAKGEGVFGLVYRVPDLDAGEARAIAAGHPRQGDRINCFDANPEWRSRFLLALEAPIAPIAGIEVTLIQLDPAD
jgi:hypothetical protein